MIGFILEKRDQYDRIFLMYHDAYYYNFECTALSKKESLDNQPHI